MSTQKNLHDLFNGTILTREAVKKQYALAIMIAVLMCFYIGFGFHADKQHRDLDAKKKELQDAKYELLTTRATLIELTRQSTLAGELKKHGSQIKPNEKPLIKIH